MDNKTQTDELALLADVTAMVKAGRDGVEAGLSTTEFWLTSTAVVVDVVGPHFGVLQSIDPNEQGLIAMALVLAYTALRSWRKTWAPVNVLASPGAEPAPESPVAPAPSNILELPKAA